MPNNFFAIGQWFAPRKEPERKQKTNQTSKIITLKVLCKQTIRKQLKKIVASTISNKSFIYLIIPPPSVNDLLLEKN
jgi:hypothetical protein